MRDPTRIRPLLARLAVAWEKCPDLRLGQLIENADADSELSTIEDESLISAIESHVATTTYIDSDDRFSLKLLDRLFQRDNMQLETVEFDEAFWLGTTSPVAKEPK